MVNKNKKKEEEEEEKQRIVNEKNKVSTTKKPDDYDYLVRSLQFDSQKAQVKTHSNTI